MPNGTRRTRTADDIRKVSKDWVQWRVELVYAMCDSPTNMDKGEAILVTLRNMKERKNSAEEMASQEVGKEWVRTVGQRQKETPQKDMDSLSQFSVTPILDNTKRVAVDAATKLGASLRSGSHVSPSQFRPRPIMVP